MNPQTIYEFIGYAGSILIAISLLMKSLIRLRILNAIGALVYVVYGILIQAYPISFLNGLIVIIDLFYLLQMFRRSDYFSIMEVTPDSTYLRFFLGFHAKDIKQFFPKFLNQTRQGNLTFFVLRNTIPAGVVIIRPDSHQGHILLDYALSDYRDFKIGAFIFDDNSDILRDRGITYLVAETEVPSHARYLQKMGFRKGQDLVYTRDLGKNIIKDSDI